MDDSDRKEESGLVPTESGLWIPRRYVGQLPMLGANATNAKFDAAGPMSFVHVFAGYDQLVGDTPSSLDNIIARLQKSSLRQIVDTISRISLTLIAYEDNRSWAAQIKIALHLFGAERTKELLKNLERMRNKDVQESVVLFHERQTLTLLKLAMLVLDSDVVREDLPLAEIGEALLMMNDILDITIEGLDPAIDADRDELELHWFANASFNRGSNLFGDFARTYDMYLRDHRDLADFIDLNQALENATGLSATNTWFALRALHGSYFVLTPEDIDRDAGVIHASTFFSAEYDFTPADSRQLVSLVTRDISELQQDVRANFKTDDLQSFDVLLFAQSPVISFEETSYCISLPLLRDAAGLNFQHRFLNQTVFSEKDRTAFLNYRGSLFGSYVENLLIRSVGSDRVIGSHVLEERANYSGSCDAVVLYGDAVILFEIKAALVHLDARSAKSFDTYLELLRRTIVKGTSQIDKTIGLIERGACIDLGADPSVIREYVPVVVTLEIVSNHAIVRRLNERCNELDLLKQRGCRPLQLMDISDVELMELATDKGKSIRDLLSEKASDELSVGMPLKNFCIAGGLSWANAHNPYLELTMEEASQEMLAWLQKRKRP